MNVEGKVRRLSKEHLFLEKKCVKLRITILSYDHDKYTLRMFTPIGARQKENSKIDKTNM